MRKYNKVSTLTEVGYEYTKVDSTAGYTKWTYYHNGYKHRTEGPAEVYIPISGKPDTYYYYEGMLLVRDLELFHKIRTCPIEDLPLYLNSKFPLIVKDRLEATHGNIQKSG